MNERTPVEVYMPTVQQGMEVLPPVQAELGVVHRFISRSLEAT